jgi:hypothetical protein
VLIPIFAITFKMPTPTALEESSTIMHRQWQNVKLNMMASLMRC